MSTKTTTAKPPTFREAQKQTTLIFTLTMPGINSANGRWSGEGQLFALIRPLPRTIPSIEHAKQLLAAGSWRYEFGDGWIAQVNVRQGDTEDVRKTRRLSQGFAGYEWMVKNILEHGSPYPKHQITPP